MSVTPLRRQYLQIKKRYPDVIVFFRLGDFYETFDDDARLTSRELEITLTSREMGKGLRVPLAGIPYHAVEGYLSRLINKGYKVAICEQMTPPGKGLVERDVVRVVTPGTVIEPELLADKKNNYLAGLIIDGDKAGIAFIDITTGEFATTQLSLSQVADEIERLSPAEILLPKSFDYSELSLSVSVTQLDDIVFDQDEASDLLIRHFNVSTLDGYGCGHLPLAIRVAGAILHYVEETQKTALGQINSLSTYFTESYMALDAHTRRNLELFTNARWGDNRSTLLSIIDATKTSMGSRLLKKWLGQPLLDIDELARRQNVVEWFCDHTVNRHKIVTLLSSISDLERLVNRIRSFIAGPRDLIGLRIGLERVPEILDELGAGDNLLAWLCSQMKPCPETIALITHAIADDAPAALEHGGVIKAGFSEDLDRLRTISKDAKQYLANLEQQERERTGIKSLKVGYNRVFGYYIEVSNSNLSSVPSTYIRKQTLVNAERFITPELKEYESAILNAQERILELESSLFKQICQQVALQHEPILSTASALAHLDVFAGFAHVAVANNYIRPVLNKGDAIEIREGRHPVVEQNIGAVNFIANDTLLDNNDTQLIILTGPNMAGKSTYLKQVALIVLMAQIGSFVPAKAAAIGIVDRIFTRIGAQEDLASGQSTFMVEMVEVANILHNATAKSLVILDEVGRGTRTYDGVSIAWAVV
ncbi:MAG TPA: DNA mismatch repair protein MutS, partial [Dehalococcoidia bacterium]|nr:DNA mismatch repair protein MutS [Dehalococcoidia bacterium]